MIIRASKILGLSDNFDIDLKLCILFLSPDLKKNGVIKYFYQQSENTSLESDKLNK